jgi:beta-ribofuranosylaminobenzene 5'-phosphate synthase
MTRSVHIRTPCRLHFGMFSFGHADQPQFGGVGMMIDPPAVELDIVSAAHLDIRGPLANRVRQFVESAVEHWRLPTMPDCEITVQSPSDHTGLGVGTQLGLAVSTGLRRFLDLPELPSQELAASVERGKRSAVGTFGFHRGGLIVNAGKPAGESLGRLAHRLSLQPAWRIVLVRPDDQQGLAGASEAGAFAKLPPVPVAVTKELWRLTEQEMLPAVRRADCAAFGEAVYCFNRLAGECFAAVQGTAYASSQIGQIVTAIRDHGIHGVGQSSWGPTVFAILPNDAEARELAEWLHKQKFASPQEITIAKPNNQGAMIAAS